MRQRFPERGTIKTVSRTIPDYIHKGRATDFLDNPKDYRLRRGLEMLPGILSWTTLVAMLVGSFLVPHWVALFIIAFDTYWVINGLYFAVFIIRNTVRMKRHQREDWVARLEALPQGDIRVPVDSWKDVIHLVVFPFYQESADVLRSTMDAMLASDFPHEQIWVVLAGERRAGETAQKTAAAIEKEYAHRFGRFLLTAHPADTPGELAGKGSNQAYALREVAVPTLIDAAKISYERVLVSSFDSDTRVYPGYFSCLTYHFLTAPHPQRSSYQPIAVYNNNIWEAPLLSRLPAIGSTAWQLFMQSQPNLQETFSSHSMPLRALADVGYWNARLVSEDSIIFWQCYLLYDGDYDMVSLYYPVSMDANVASNIWTTAKSIFKQYRRWAYGIEKIAFVWYGFAKNPRIPWRKKLKRGSKIIAGFWIWATASFMLLFLGWLPVAIGGEVFRQTVLAFNLPRWTAILMRLAMLGLLVNGALTFILLPPRPKGTSRMVYVSVLLQWFFLPISIILFGAVPALSAQTKMLRGKYLGFWVTEKVRKGKYEVADLSKRK